MALHNFHPVANGLGTDHPIPDLPFVDDSHLPLHDPAAIEKIGRYGGSNDMGGRTDRVRPDGGWIAYTTDPRRHDLAWLVRWHPEHGRSVVLYRDEDASSVYMTLWGPALLFRSGGYWWDGESWYRPSQIFDRASEAYVRRPVPAAATVHAADLADSGDAGRAAAVLTVDEVDLDTPARPGQWWNDLAAWAARRPQDALPLQRCVVQLNAPELAAGQLVALSGLAQIAGVGESTLRAYQARGQGSLPAPQASPGGRAMWSLPVAQEWAEQRHHSPDGAAATMSSPDRENLSIGVSTLWDRFTRLFLMDLWDRPGWRKRWALRYRTAPAVRDVATALGWTVAASLEQIVPLKPLADTLGYALLDELSTGKQLAAGTGRGESMDEHSMYGIQHGVAEMLGWLIQHAPYRASGVINEVIGEAEQRLQIPRAVVVNSIRTAMSLDGGVDETLMREFLDRTLAPA
jgi:hypothetical protein